MHTERLLHVLPVSCRENYVDIRNDLLEPVCKVYTAVGSEIDIEKSYLRSVCHREEDRVPNVPEAYDLGVGRRRLY